MTQLYQSLAYVQYHMLKYYTCFIDTCSARFIVALFTTAKKWNKLNGLQQMNGLMTMAMQYIYPLEYYLIVKKIGGGRKDFIG